MKKIFLLISALAIFNVSATIAQTSISGGTVSGTWTTGGSPYNITGSIQIPSDSTLIIQPGVIVNFQGAYKLNVQGRLFAIGTALDSITFTVSDTTNGWRGIRFNSTPTTNDTSKIIFCKLLYGKATGSSPDNCGGALYFNSFSKAIISNSSILNCTANASGAGIYCNNSSPYISNNIISNNIVINSVSGGGGIFCDNGSNPNICNNTISNNTAKGPGASGGGIFCYGNPAIINNIIKNNIAESFGGGIYFQSSYSGITSGNTISYNTCNNRGGGIYCGSINYPSFIKNIICDNTAGNGGGFFFTSATNATLSNNIICNNTATTYGGAIYCENSSIPTFINSTITNNNAVEGGALYCTGSSIPAFRNCILYGNTASTSGAQVFLYDDASDPNFYYCDVQGGSSAFDVNGNFYTGTYSNNINLDPKFVSPSGGSGNGYNGMAADWSLQNTSPCIDNGDPTYSPYPSTDIAGNPRINVCRIDIGAYEYQMGVPFTLTMNVSQPISCYGTTGGLTAIVSGGTLPYSYNWNNGQTTANISGITAGNYTVTVSDSSAGCTLTKNITLSQPPATSVYVGADTTISCGGFAHLYAQPKWAKISSSITTNLNSVFFTNTNTGYALGGGGAIFKTTDGGTSWVQLTSGTIMWLGSIYFTDSITGYAVGNSGIILKTSNGGINWSQQSITPPQNYNSIYFANKNTGYIVGSSGTILKTTNGGASWAAQTSNTTNDLYSVYFIQADTGYAVGLSGTILKTTNGGTNWVTQNIGTTSIQLHSVHFTTGKIGYAGGMNNSMAMASILKTTNGGSNWTVQNLNATQINSMFFINADTAYAVSSLAGTSKILKTTDGGNNWSLQSSGYNNDLYSVYFTDANTGYAVGQNGIILKLVVPVSYSWSPASGLNGTNIVNPIANPAVTTPYIVSAISKNGCIANDTVVVFVNPLKANAGTDKSIICGNTAQLDSVTINYTGSGILKYHWSPSTGLNNDTIANPKVTAAADTKYIVTVTTPAGCTAIDSIVVHVNPLIADAGLDNSIICGGAAQLNATTNYTGTGKFTYHWSPAAGLNYDTIQNPKATVTTDTKYFVTVTTPNGCKASDSVVVHVNPLIADAGLDNSLICGGAAQLNATANYTGTGTLIYHWSPIAGLNYDTIQDPKATVIQNTKFYVTVTTPNGCTATDSVTVSVNPLTANAGSNKTSICGGTVQLDNVFTNYTGGGTLKYYWSPSTGLNYDTVQNPSVTLFSNSTYSVTVTTPNGCSATSNVSVSLTPMDAPEICVVGVDSLNKNRIIWNKTISTAIDSFYIYKETGTTNVYARIGAVPYNNLSVFVDNSSYPNVQSNKYKISIFDDCGLESAQSDYHKTMHLTINQGTASNIWNLIWEEYYGFTVSSYKIYRGTSPDTLLQIGNVLGGNTTYTDVAPTGYVYYQIEVVSPNSCNPTKSYNSSRSNIATNNGSGINENINASDLVSIYPDPAKASITIDFDAYSNDHSFAEIFSVDGKLLQHISITQKKTDVDISLLPSGIYIIKVTGNNDVAIKKLVKE